MPCIIAAIAIYARFYLEIEEKSYEKISQTAAFVAFMARETNPLYTATQLALFTSLSALPSKGLGMLSGYLVKAVGYYHFFWICLFLAIPGMICLFWVAPWNEKGNEKA